MGFWVATGRWRDYPPVEGGTAEGGTSEEVAAVARRLSRLVHGSILAVAVPWVLADAVISFLAV